MPEILNALTTMRLLLCSLLLVSPLVSCQKVKDLADKAKQAAGSVTTPKAVGPLEASAPGGEIDKSLESLIDRNEEGVRFRKDLPFPQRLEVIATTTTEYQNMRVFSQSAFGSGSGSMSGIVEKVVTYQKEGNRIAFKSETSARAPTPATPDASAPAPKAAPAAPAPKPGSPPAPAANPEAGAPPAAEKSVLSAGFQFKDGRWMAEREEDFLRAAKIREMQPGFGAKAAEDGLLPREIWFGKTRWKEGSKLTVSDREIAMILSAGVTGKLDLVFETVEAVGGHPCGRFSIKGKCSGKIIDAPDSDNSGHMDMSITDGKVWLSLLHPVVMRAEYELIATTSGKQGGISARAQGGMTLKQSLVWKPGT